MDNSIKGYNLESFPESTFIAVEIESGKCSTSRGEATRSERIENNTFEAMDETASDEKQPCSNIKNILNLGQEVPDENQALKSDEAKSVKRFHHKCSFAGKCKHKLNALKKKNSHSKKHHCRSPKKERGRNPDLVGDSDTVPFEVGDEHNLTEQLSYDSEIYDPVRDIFYDKFTKVELIERWIKTEDQIESTDKHLNAIRERKRLLGLSGVDVDAEIAKIQVFKEEINKLIEENNELFQANEKLKSYLNTTEEQETYERQ